MYLLTCRGQVPARYSRNTVAATAADQRINRSRRLRPKQNHCASLSLTQGGAQAPTPHLSRLRMSAIGLWPARAPVRVGRGLAPCHNGPMPGPGGASKHNGFNLHLPTRRTRGSPYCCEPVRHRSTAPWAGRSCSGCGTGKKAKTIKGPKAQTAKCRRRTTLTAHTARGSCRRWSSRRWRRN